MSPPHPTPSPTTQVLMKALPSIGQLQCDKREVVECDRRVLVMEGEVLVEQGAEMEAANQFAKVGCSH